MASGEFGFYNYVDDSNRWIDVFGLSAYAPTHHIATNKDKAWKGLFQSLFRKHGFGKFKNGRERKDVLNDPRNKVDVVGHKGPHNEPRFHEKIYDRLKKAGEKGGDAGFEVELAKMKTECTQIGSDMNKIITKTY
ncbi:AHH domain-containing protein [Flavobacterium sp. 140616W15]|uniref:AHH domain-containing protein n=1 Tax=Flavobacterium sp. 140616W15 TaxID=2478552 RepID=UPI001A92A94E|nr:AHH domain-containing protein [Flavobacterium sp. 140616W15]